MIKQLTVALCDDDYIQLEIFKTFIENHQSNYNFEAILSTDGQELLLKIKNRKIDIAFLDIKMDTINGLEVGRHIRKLNPDAIIVFITGYRDYSFDSFEVKAFDYILKPFNKERFNRLFKEVLERYEEIYTYKTLNNYFVLPIKNGIIKLMYNNICYFEKQLRKVKVYTDNTEYSFYYSFKELVKELNMNFFIQVHQGFIVNRSKIKMLHENNVYLDKPNCIIPVSRRHKKGLTEFLTNKLFYDGE